MTFVIIISVHVCILIIIRHISVPGFALESLYGWLWEIYIPASYTFEAACTVAFEWQYIGQNTLMHGLKSIHKNTFEMCYWWFNILPHAPIYVMECMGCTSFLWKPGISML